MTLENPGPLAELIQEAIRASPFQTQSAVARELKINPPLLSDYLRGNRVAPTARLLELARLLKLDTNEVLMAARLTELAREAKARGPDDETLVGAVGRFSKLYERVRTFRSGARGLGHTSLEAFPALTDGTWKVVLPDRRECPPQGLGDLMALSGSSSDVMYLFKLHLDSNTEILSDKILRVARKDDLKGLLNANLLVIGSPAVSLATRAVLAAAGSTFVFNIGQRDYDAEEEINRSLQEDDRHNLEALSSFFQSIGVRERVDNLLATFRKNGFVDPVDFQGIRGRSIPRHKDYGVIALAANPWSPDHMVCICAGVHAPGTAGAVQMLGRPEVFKDRPWGGILTVQLSDQARWENRFRYLNPKWETHPYSVEQYGHGLIALIQGIEQKQQTERAEEHREVQISSDMLKRIQEFTQTRLLRNPSSPPEED